MRAPRAIWAAILLLGAVGVSWQAVSATLARIQVETDPEGVLKRRPNDARALAALAEQVLVKDGMAGAGRASELARRSIAITALNPRALRTLGAAQAAPADQIRLINLAERVSRRDIGTQLMLIEYNVQREDLTAALRHYDIAMRTSEDVREMLYPILTTALSDPSVRQAVVGYVKTPRNWTQNFLTTANIQTKDSAALVDLVRQVGGLPDGDAYRFFEEGVLHNLVNAADFRRAIEFYGLIRGADRTVAFKPDLNADSVNPRYAPVTWRFSDASSAQAGANNAMEITTKVNADISGIAAEKLLGLAAGSYTLNVKYQWLSEDPSARATWQVRCANEGNQIVVTHPQMIASDTSEHAMTANFVTRCSPIMLTLVTSGGDAGGSDLIVRKIGLRRE